MSDWDDFWQDTAGSVSQEGHLGLYTEVSLTSRLTQRHALRFTFEWITTSSWAAFDLGGTGAYTVEWDFETFPVCASYELTLRGAGPGVLTTLGVGAGYYMSEVKSSTIGFINPTSDTRHGDGYGFHGYLRQTALIAEHLSLSGMIRGRWADGMAFDDNEGDIQVEFSGVDVSLGLEWRI
jgi:hypothetical protein